MSVGFHITDGCRLRTGLRSPMHRRCCGQAGMAGGPRTAWWPVRCRAYKALAVSETQGRAGHYKINSTKSSNTLHTCAGPGSVAHHPYTDTSGIYVHWAVPRSTDCGLASEHKADYYARTFKVLSRTSSIFK